jgi:peptide/nickel transport system ATP-binding protein
MKLLEVENLGLSLRTSRGRVPALRRLNFTLERGGTLGLVGESGSGKSLTALALLGLLPDGAVTEGQIRFDGRNLLTLREAEWCDLRGDRIAMTFQEPMTALNPLQTIGWQIMEPLLLHRRLTRAAAADEAVRLLDRVGIPEPRRRLAAYPHQLSGGQRQRAMIAMALSCNPALLVADEPTTALDATVQGQILALLRELVAERGMAMVLISHDLNAVAETCHDIAVMYGGAIVESGPADEVFARPSHPYTRGLLAALPAIDDAVAAVRPRLATIPGAVPDLADFGIGCTFAERCAFAIAACRAAPPPAVAVGPRHEAACIRLEAVT